MFYLTSFYSITHNLTCGRFSLSLLILNNILLYVHTSLSSILHTMESYALLFFRTMRIMLHRELEWDIPLRSQLQLFWIYHCNQCRKLFVWKSLCEDVKLCLSWHWKWWNIHKVFYRNLFNFEIRQKDKFLKVLLVRQEIIFIIEHKTADLI